MGGLVFKAVAKKGKDKLTPAYNNLHDIPVTDIKGKDYANLGHICQGKKCVMVVNVASK